MRSASLYSGLYNYCHTSLKIELLVLSSAPPNNDVCLLLFKSKNVSSLMTDSVLHLHSFKAKLKTLCLFYFPPLYRGLYFKASVRAFQFVGAMATAKGCRWPHHWCKNFFKREEACPGLRNPSISPVQNNDFILLGTNEAGFTHCFFGKAIL